MMASFPKLVLRIVASSPELSLTTVASFPQLVLRIVALFPKLVLSEFDQHVPKKTGTQRDELLI